MKLNSKAGEMSKVQFVTWYPQILICFCKRHNRYRWFGKQESCMMPTPELRRRFVG